MENDISPKYIIQLIQKIEDSLWQEFKSYKNVQFYIQRWQEEISYNDYNFYIRDSNGKLDLPSTLHGIDSNTLLKMAIDLGIETPDFIPCVPVFKNTLKESYQSAFDSFSKALKNIEEHPDIAIGLANSTLESILKEILKDERTQSIYDKKKTLYKLTVDVLKEFQLFPNNGIPEEITKIGSSILSMNQHIEKLRSEKTDLHGKDGDDYKIEDPMYAYFVVNGVSSIGLFLNAFYKSKFPPLSAINIEDNFDDEEDDLPF
jgi:hypothetical protein